MIISDADKTEVEHAIEVAERKTSGDIVVVIARESGGYFYVPYLWASLIALVLPWPLIHWTWMPVQEIYLLQLATFAVLAVILHYRPLRFALVPGSVKRQNAHRRAMEQFLAQNLHTTSGRTGVLLFVSVAERYVEVIADEGVHAKVPDSEWRDIVDELTASIGRGEAAKGLVSAVRRIGDHLAAHFPADKDHTHALPNHLIILSAA
jgi:putative membrane protein